ncbi:hypothetical protein ACWCXC_15635 [Streptomyces sp. NPDC001515]
MFKAEEKVKYARMAMPATILSGPHNSPGHDRYLIRKADGNVSLVKFTELSPLAPEDPRVEVLTRALMVSYEIASESMRESFRVKAKRLLATIDRASAPEPEPLTKGSRIRILKRSAEGAIVREGDVLEVVHVTRHYVCTEAPRSLRNRNWAFQLSGEGDLWERV